MMSARRTLVLGAVLLLSLGHPANAGAIDFAAGKSYPVGTGPTVIVVGDFNGDGKADLAVANGGSNDVSILLNNGDGTFASAVNYAVTSVGGPVSVALGDFN